MDSIAWTLLVLVRIFFFKFMLHPNHSSPFHPPLEPPPLAFPPAHSHPLLPKCKASRGESTNPDTFPWERFKSLPAAPRLSKASHRRDELQIVSSCTRDVLIFAVTHIIITIHTFYHSRVLPTAHVCMVSSCVHR